MSTSVITSLMLLANLLLPQQIVRYSACCYDENGNYAPCSMESANDDGPAIQDQGCCSIRKVDLKLPLPAVETNGKQEVLPYAHSAMPAPQVELVTSHDVFADTVSALLHGPPDSGNILTAHSRLNL